MPVTREDVEWAYRMLLGREVESEAVLQGHQLLADRASLRQAIMCSDEFVNGAIPPGAIGRFQNVADSRVEVGCSPDQLNSMTQHIAAEWRKYGVETPHWSVLTHSDFLPENIARNVEEFYATGREHAKTMLNPIARSGGSIERFNRVMDFGCGVGRLTLALAPKAAEIVGVDISPPHLALARDRAGSETNAKFVSINTVEQIGTLGQFDLIVSFIVIQHNPPPVMAEILRMLLSCLVGGGFIIIQIPTYINGYAFRLADYLAAPRAGIDANPLPQHIIFKIFAEAGCDVLEVREDNFLGGPSLSHTFAARKR